MNGHMWLGRIYSACLIGFFVQSGPALPQSNCLPPRDSSYVKFDGSGFVVRKSPDFDKADNVDFKILPCEMIGMDKDLRDCLAIFAVEHIEFDGTLVKVQIHVDDDLEWVGIPVDRLAEVRFSQSLADWTGDWYHDNLEGVPPCALGARRAKAQSMFASAFELLRQGKYKAAEDLFGDGLALDPTNGTAAIYFAETKLRAGDADGMMLSYYARGYELLGVPPEIEKRAINEQAKRIGR